MKPEYHIFVQTIYQFGKRCYRLGLIGGAIHLAVILAVLWLSVALADSLFFFSTITRWGLWFIHLILMTAFSVRLLGKPLLRYAGLRKISDLSPIALTMGRYYGELQDHIVNTYQLIARNQPESISTALVQAAVDANLKTMAGYDFLKKPVLQEFLPSRILIAAALFSFSFLFGFQSGELWRSTLRLINPANEYLPAPQFSFQVLPGDCNILRGEPIQIEAVYSGPALRGCELLIHDGSDDQPLQVTAMDFKNDRYVANLNDARQTVRYRIRGRPLFDAHLNGRLLSDFYTIRVKTPPALRALDISIEAPAYARLERQMLDRNIGDITALAGSKIFIKAESTKPLRSATLQFEKRPAQSLKINELRASGDFTIHEDDVYSIMLTDTSGLASLNPIQYHIASLPDMPPLVDIPEPGSDVESRLDATLPLRIESSDDFGVGSIQLLYQFGNEADSAVAGSWLEYNLDLSEAGARNQEISYLLDFNKMPLTFSDVLKYFARARDNNNINGPGIGESKIYYVRFPSLDEIFETFDKNQDEVIENLSDAAEEAEKLKKTLEEINRDLKRAEKIDWNQKQQMNKALEQQQALQGKMEDAQQQLQEMIDKLDNNNLISPEVLEKYQQLQQLFKDVITPELMEAIREMQQSVEKAVSPDDMRQALENFRQQQDAFEKAIERTMELLKQVRLEQKMDELVQRARKLEERQQKITEQLSQKEKPGEEAFQRLEAQQKEQSDQLDRLREDVAEMRREELPEKLTEARQSLDEALSRLNSEQLSSQLQQMEQQLANRRQQNSAQSSQSLEKQLGDIRNSLSMAQSSMLQQGKNQIREKMANAMQRLLQLSQQQEALKKRTQSTSSLSDAFNDINRQQGQLAENYQKVISEMLQLSKETFFMNPQMSGTMQRAMQGMQRSMGHLGEREGAQAAQNQENTMSALNENAMQLRQSMSQLAQAQSGTGFEQLMQQLQQMAGAQGQINEQTLGLTPGEGNQGRLSLQQQGETRRLAGEQAALRQAMEELQGQMGNRQDVLGRIGELAGKMDEVVQDLLQQNVDRNTINRQREILSRMLDAQKSLHERDQSRQRKAEQAKQYSARDPRALGKTADEQKKLLQDALRRAREQGYSPDYLQLIEAYFKTLMEDKQQ
jgi:hypothetical protein